MRNKKYFPMLLAFVVPLLIWIGICIGNGVYPFGDNCILHIDLYHQYCPFFTEFILYRLRRKKTRDFSKETSPKRLKKKKREQMEEKYCIFSNYVYNRYAL